MKITLEPKDSLLRDERTREGWSSVKFEEVRSQAWNILNTGHPEATAQAETVMRDYLSRSDSCTRDKGMAIGYLAELLMMQGRYGEAQFAFVEAESMLETPVDKLTVKIGHASFLYSTHRQSAAAFLQPRLSAVLQEHAAEVVEIAPWGYAAEAKLFRLLNRPHDALVSARLAVSTSEGLPNKPGRIEAYFELSISQEALGDLAGALDSLEIAMSVMKKGHCLMQARARHSHLAIRLGDKQSAFRSLCKAVELPDLRDRRVIASVLRAIAEYGDIDPQGALRLNLELAAHLECSVSEVG